MMGLPEVLTTVFIFLGIASAIGMRLGRNRTATLVLQKFSIAVEPQSTPKPTVEIVGRMQGIVAFALSLLGFSPITRFTIAGTELRCQSSSLFGQRSQFIPLRCVSTMAAGIHKPIAAIIWAALITVLGCYLSFEMRTWAPIAIALVVAIILVVMYVLTKKFFIEVYSQGGPPISLLFKPNVIEGVPIDIEQALAVVDVIRDMILHDGATALTQRHAANTQQRDNHPTAANEALPWTSQAEEPEEEEEDEEEQATQLFVQARQYAQNGDNQRAISTLQEIVRHYPQTQTADNARRMFAKKRNNNIAAQQVGQADPAKRRVFGFRGCSASLIVCRGSRRLSGRLTLDVRPLRAA